MAETSVNDTKTDSHDKTPNLIMHKIINETENFIRAINTVSLKSIQLAYLVSPNIEQT